MYWSIEKIRATFEIRCENKNLEPDSYLMKIFEDEIDYEDFWSKVDNNLKLGRLRLIFLADKISNELKRIIEFLNEQMNSTEVLGVEIKQYVGKTQKTLVPNVIGQSIKIQNAKAQYVKSVKQWDKNLFLSEIENKQGIEIKKLIIAILDWCEKQNLTIDWGKGRISGSLFPMLYINNKPFWTFGVWTYGTIEIEFQFIKTQKIFSDKKDRFKLLEELNKIDGVQLSEDSIEKRPSIPFSILLKKESLSMFFKIWENYIKEIRSNSI